MDKKTEWQDLPRSKARFSSFLGPFCFQNKYSENKQINKEKRQKERETRGGWKKIALGRTGLGDHNADLVCWFHWEQRKASFIKE
jgi:hypothetical protein